MKLILTSTSSYSFEEKSGELGHQSNQTLGGGGEIKYLVFKLTTLRCTCASSYTFEEKTGWGD